jgi:ureidoglycolate hydrolase
MSAMSAPKPEQAPHWPGGAVHALQRTQDDQHCVVANECRFHPFFSPIQAWIPAWASSSVVAVLKSSNSPSCSCSKASNGEG